MLPRGTKPPTNVEAEQAVIGTVLHDNDVYIKLSDTVRADHFSEKLHREIWTVVASLIGERGETADAVTLKSFLGEQDLGGVTPMAYLQRLRAEATDVITALDYAKTVRDLWIRREIIRFCETAVERAYRASTNQSADSLFAEIESHLDDLRPALRNEGDYIPFNEALIRAEQEAAAAYKRGGKLVGLSTGLDQLDDAVGGLQRSDLIILAGRPGQGKSALAANVATHVARRLMEKRSDGRGTGVVGFVSLEMSEVQITQRIRADLAGVPFWKLRRGIASGDEMERYMDAGRELRDLPLRIDPTGGISITQLKARARALRKRAGLELLIVDYLQLLSGSGRNKDGNRVQEVTEITNGLKTLAKELNIPIIALSQLSRKVEERDDKRPMLSDLRESGSIEQDADIIMSVYREEYYLKKTMPRNGGDALLRWEAAMHKAKGVAEIIINKNRHGPEGTVTLGFQPEYTRFTNEPEPRLDYAEVEATPGGRKPKVQQPTTPEGWSLYRVLKSLSISIGMEGVEGVRVPKGCKLVPRDQAVAAFAVDISGPDADDETVQKDFKKAFRDLNKGEKPLARWSGTAEAPYLWLPEFEH